MSSWRRHGDRFSIADAYLFVCLNWSQWLGIDLSHWPELEAFMRRVGARPGAREALETEGLALKTLSTLPGKRRILAVVLPTDVIPLKAKRVDVTARGMSKR